MAFRGNSVSLGGNLISLRGNELSNIGNRSVNMVYKATVNGQDILHVI